LGQLVGRGCGLRLTVKAIGCQDEANR
jgi:hypothetical protein